MLFPIKAQPIEREFEKLLYRMSFAGRYHVVVGTLLLKHHPHRLDVVAGKSPIAFRVKIAECETRLYAELDSSGAAGDLAGHEVFAAARRFVIEQNSVDANSPYASR